METTQARKFSSMHTMYCSLISSRTTQCIRTLHNFCKLKAYWWKTVIQFLDMPLWTPLMSLVVTSWPLTCTDLPWCGWSTLGTNSSEWVQIFQENSFWGELIFKRDRTAAVTLHWDLVNSIALQDAVPVTGHVHTYNYAMFSPLLVVLAPLPLLSTNA